MISGLKGPEITSRIRSKYAIASHLRRVCNANRGATHIPHPGREWARYVPDSLSAARPAAANSTPRAVRFCKSCPLSHIPNQCALNNLAVRPDKKATNPIVGQVAQDADAPFGVCLQSAL